jgi:hypothetical protein
MMIILAFLLLAAAQANNYILPVSITGHYSEERPINRIEPSSQPFIRYQKTEPSYLYFIFIAFIILSTIVLSRDPKISQRPVYHINEHAVYYQPLPPIQEEDENPDDEQDNPIPLHYVNPYVHATCEDPCICT